MNKPQESNLDDVDMPAVIGKISAAMENTLSTGDLAELRRISPDEPYTPALWKILLSFVPASWTAGRHQDREERRWAVVLMGMAMTVGQHDPGEPLGDALAEAGWSELRFVRLMRARDERLVDEVRRLASYLASKSASFDWSDIGQLVFNQEGEWAERHRRRIARDYYRELYKHEN